MKYFVSYYATMRTNVQGWGRCSVTRDYPITGVDEIDLIEKAIKINNDAHEVTVLNWRRFEDAE